jgi:hypothetical protein
MVAGASCPIQSQDRPADAATSLALLTWIWQLANRHQTDASCRTSGAEHVSAPYEDERH